jgi:hypothetical protein
LESCGCDEVGGRDPADGVGGVEIRSNYGVSRGSDGSVETGEEDVAKYCYFSGSDLFILKWMFPIGVVSVTERRYLPV